jgi:hypothetical protein
VPAIVKPSREGPMLESELLIDVRKWLASQPDVSIHRNNVGSASMTADDFARAGMDRESAETAAGVVSARFRGMKFGLSIGSSDLIGSLTVDLSGFGVIHSKIARFLAIELKQPGKNPTDDQARFLDDKRKAGAVAFWADNLQTVIDMIQKARAWEI